MYIVVYLEDIEELIDIINKILINVRYCLFDSFS